MIRPVLEGIHDIMICAPCIYGVINQLGERRCSIEEIHPPWQPDGRARRASHFYLAKLPIPATIAEFEVAHWAP